jgi:hypothetical protein
MPQLWQVCNLPYAIPEERVSLRPIRDLLQVCQGQLRGLGEALDNPCAVSPLPALLRLSGVLHMELVSGRSDGTQYLSSHHHHRDPLYLQRLFILFLGLRPAVF